MKVFMSRSRDTGRRIVSWISRRAVEEWPCSLFCLQRAKRIVYKQDASDWHQVGIGECSLVLSPESKTPTRPGQSGFRRVLLYASANRVLHALTARPYAGAPLTPVSPTAGARGYLPELPMQAHRPFQICTWVDLVESR